MKTKDGIHRQVASTDVRKCGGEFLSEELLDKLHYLYNSLLHKISEGGIYALNIKITVRPRSSGHLFPGNRRISEACMGNDFYIQEIQIWIATDPYIRGSVRKNGMFYCII